MPKNTVRIAKQTVRERVWQSLEREGVVPAGVAGRIPTFTGTEAAAERLALHPAWRGARIVKAVPDTAQTPVRARALAEGKHLYMAAPKLAAPKPFYHLAPDSIGDPAEAADRRTAVRLARPVDVQDIPPVDLVVCGSVAVNPKGVRLGKGAGYADIEVGLLQEAGLIHPDTLIVTTVHDLQVLDEELPEADHDFRLDLIVTPTRIIACGPRHTPPGILWELLPDAYLSAIPALTARRPTSDQTAASAQRSCAG
ncbi:5-formyltetrahydrofolate cyclo-ligase [Streptomyces sp. NPDC057638]|uniref:5-formyltetrahydrofolate cyclo-ligase n=1 Tax=Streptomyces sp. NPDC057638 TaxID=3346190 RepID=UPI0036A257B8